MAEIKPLNLDENIMDWKQVKALRTSIHTQSKIFRPREAISFKAQSIFFFHVNFMLELGFDR